MLSMRFNESRELLKTEKSIHPDNLIPLFIENYEDFLRCAFNEDKEEFNRLYVHKEERQDLLSEGNEQSPYYRYCKAQIALHWALINLKFENHTAAFFDIRKAYNLLTENKKLYPDFKPTLISLGFLHAIIGTIPDTYKWAVNLVGFHGTITEGKQEILLAITYGEKNHFVFLNEARYMYIILQLIVLNDKSGAYQTVSHPGFPSHYGNALSCFTRAYVALKNYKNDEAIRYFTYNIFNNKSFILYNYYMLGMCQLNKLNTDARYNLKYFSDHFKGVNYLKDARHRIAWCALINGDQTAYLDNLISILKHGNTLSDSDKSAQKIAERKIIPHAGLLKARLLMDGGYLTDAMFVLNSIASKELSTTAMQTEYSYRKGRIFHLQGKHDEAILQCMMSIEKGKNLNEYFAANAAMELGTIYEGKKDYTKAATYYRMSLNMPESDFKNSIDIRSKAGLQRVSK